MLQSAPETPARPETSPRQARGRQFETPAARAPQDGGCGMRRPARCVTLRRQGVPARESGQSGAAGRRPGEFRRNCNPFQSEPLMPDDTVDPLGDVLRLPIGSVTAHFGQALNVFMALHLAWRRLRVQGRTFSEGSGKWGAQDEGYDGSWRPRHIVTMRLPFSWSTSGKRAPATRTKVGEPVFTWVARTDAGRRRVRNMTRVAPALCVFRMSYSARTRTGPLRRDRQSFPN